MAKRIVALAAEQRIPRRANSHQAPLSFSQQPLWFLDPLQQERGGYQIVAAVRWARGAISDPSAEEEVEL